MSKNASRGGDDNGVKVDFGLSSDSLSEEAKKAWPFKFSLVYSVTLGKDGLQTMLQVRNEGKEAFDFQMLLHSYFKVAVSLLSFYTSYLTLRYLGTFFPLPKDCVHTIYPTASSKLIIINCQGHFQNPNHRPRQRHLHRQSPQRHRTPTNLSQSLHYRRSRSRLQIHQTTHHLHRRRRETLSRRDARRRRRRQRRVESVGGKIQEYGRF